MCFWNIQKISTFLQSLGRGRLDHQAPLCLQPSSLIVRVWLGVLILGGVFGQSTLCWLRRLLALVVILQGILVMRISDSFDE